MVAGYVLSWIYLGYGQFQCLSIYIYRSNIPKAAVFRVPKGRLRSDTGSQTSISPSKMMLYRMCVNGGALKKVTEIIILVDTRIESLSNVLRQAACPTIFPIKICVILPFPVRPYQQGKARLTRASFTSNNRNIRLHACVIAFSPRPTSLP